MINRRQGSILGIAIMVGFVLADEARAVAPEIKDDGKFFSAEAIKKANKQIKEIARKYDKDLLIETFAAVPGDQSARVKAMSSEERDKFFLNWATDRAESAVVNGVYILISKDPSRLEIVITKKARSIIDKQAFDKLRELLLKNFREKHYDEGLQAAVDFVREKLAAASK
jgi:uncharacterized membrane protein YgcG